jgi:hypothetical protein
MAGPRIWLKRRLKLQVGGGVAETAALALGSNTDPILVDILGLSKGKIVAPRDAGAFST